MIQVVQNGVHSAPGQPIVQAFVIQQQQPVPFQPVNAPLVTGANPAGGNPPPYHAVANPGVFHVQPQQPQPQPAGNPMAPGGEAPFSGYPSMMISDPTVADQPNNYMPLLRTSTENEQVPDRPALTIPIALATGDLDFSRNYENPDAAGPPPAYLPPQVETPGSDTYAYIDVDDVDHQENRGRLSIPDEHYDDVSAPQAAAAPGDSGPSLLAASTPKELYSYAGPDSLTSRDATSPPPASTPNSTEEYSYAGADSLTKKDAISSADGTREVYANDSRVQRSLRGPADDEASSPMSQEAFAGYIEIVP